MSLKLASDDLKSIWWAIPIPAPYGKPRPRRLTLKIGLRYERACMQAIRNAVGPENEVIASQWIRYQRYNGENNICQPDIVVVERGLIIVIECKNTWVETAWEQINLYCEVCNEIFKRRTIGFQMCKNVTPRTRERIVRDWDSAVSASLTGLPITLHWSGKGAL